MLPPSFRSNAAQGSAASVPQFRAARALPVDARISRRSGVLTSRPLLPGNFASQMFP